MLPREDGYPGYLRFLPLHLCKIKCFSIDALGIIKKHLDYFMDMSDCTVAWFSKSPAVKAAPPDIFLLDLRHRDQDGETLVFSDTVTLEQMCFKVTKTLRNANGRVSD